jgi:hypothetical protein
LKQHHGATQQIPVQTPPFRHDRGPVIPQPAQEIKNKPKPVTFATSVAAAGGRSAAIILHPLEIPESPPRSTQEQQKDRRLAELEEAIKRIKQRREQIERFKKVLDDIREKRFQLIHKLNHRGELQDVLDGLRNKRYQLHKPCSRDPLPLELQKTMLKLLPKEVVAVVTQLLHYGDFDHERSFQVPIQYSEPDFLQGNGKKHRFDPQHSTLNPIHEVDSDHLRSSLNFIDGKHDILELATCVPLPEDSYENPRYKHVDSIIIDTKTCNHTIKRTKQDERCYDLGVATSYQQRAIGSGLYSPNPMELTFAPDRLPLIQQLNFIGNYWFTWTYFDGEKDYIERGVGNTDEFDRKGQRIHPFNYGLQRNLKDGQMVWVVPKGKYVGIYEKAQPWFDESGALKHKAFESIQQDRLGNEFHLVQVIQEETPVQTVSIPHTPAYLKDKYGKELRGCIGYPPGDSTIHLRSPLYYPDRLDAIAIGFNQTETNNRCSLHKQRGDNLWEYPPTLLLDQSGIITPRKKITLYHGKELTWGESIALQATAVKRIFDSKIRGKDLPPLE